MLSTLLCILIFVFLEHEVTALTYSLKAHGGYLKGDPQMVTGNSAWGSLYHFFDSTPYSTTLFVNGNAYQYDEHYTGLSIGIGIRQRLKNLLLGINTYYEAQDNIRTIHRLGVGLECYSPLVNLAINAYFPIGGRIHVIEKTRFDGYVGGYTIDCIGRLTTPIEYDVTLFNNFTLYSPFHSYFADLRFALGIYGLEYNSCESRYGLQIGLKLERDIFYIEPKIYTKRFDRANYSVEIGCSFSLFGSRRTAHSYQHEVMRNPIIRPIRSFIFNTNY